MTKCTLKKKLSLLIRLVRNDQYDKSRWFGSNEYSRNRRKAIKELKQEIINSL